MKKSLLTLALSFFLFLGALPAAAETVTDNCEAAFDWAGDETTIDGFRFFPNNDAPVEISPADRGATCEALGVTPGMNTLSVAAYNALGESARSNTLVFYVVASPPIAPTVLRLVVTFQ